MFLRLKWLKYGTTVTVFIILEIVPQTLSFLINTYRAKVLVVLVDSEAGGLMIRKKEQGKEWVRVETLSPPTHTTINKNQDI